MPLVPEQITIVIPLIRGQKIKKTVVKDASVLITNLIEEMIKSIHSKGCIVIQCSNWQYSGENNESIRK